MQEPAAYGELSYAFNDALRATVGLRYYYIRTQVGGYLEGIAFGGPRLTDPTATTDQSGVNPKVGAEWKFAPEKMAYASIARGFRPGGIVPSIPGTATNDPLGCYQQLLQLGYTSTEQTKSFRPDHLWTYEVGSKTSWADNRLTLDGAAYLTEWDQIQQSVQLQCGFQFRANSGRAEIKGFDLETHGRPTQNLDLSLGVGFQHARITESSPQLPALQVGDRVYQVPDWTGNAATSYTIPFGNERSFIGTVTYSYTGDSVSANNGATYPRLRPGYSFLDARLAYRVRDYEFALVGKNLTNTEADLGDNRSLAAETYGRPRLVTNAPRTIGLEARAKF